MKKKINKSHNKKMEKKPFNWAKNSKRAGIALCFFGVIAITFFVSSQLSKTEYDLSVLGNGTPTMVQIHDPNCQLCQQLKSNVNGVKAEFKETVHFRTANIRSKKGKALANRYNVPHVTLLFFDGKGAHLNTLNGVSNEATIRAALTALTSR